MSQVELIGTSFSFRCKDGRMETLLDTQAYSENYSRVMMHCPDEKSDGGFTYPLVNNIIPLWYSLGNVDDWGKIVFLRILANLLKDPFSKKILFIGGEYCQQLEVLASCIKYFHPANKVYWNPANAANVPKGVIEYRMPFSELILPPQSFSVIVVVENIKDTTWLPEFKEQVLLALQWNGVLLHRQQDSKCSDKSFSLINGMVLYEWYNSKERWQICHKESIAGMVDDIRLAVGNIILNMENILQKYDENTKCRLLSLYTQLEEYILIIYPFLGNRDIKQTIAYWHEKLLDCHLDDDVDIRETFGKLKEAWEKC